MSTNDSTPDPTAGDRGGCGCAECRNGDDQWCCEPCHVLARQMSPATPDADAASTPASEGLTEAEREVLNGAIDEAETCKCCGDDYGSKHVYIAIERIIAARVADAEAKARAEGSAKALVLASDWLATRDAEHQRDRDALRLAMRTLTSACDVLLKASGLPDDTDDIDLINETVLGLASRAEAAERDRDEARRELTDLRAKVAALADEIEASGCHHGHQQGDTDECNACTASDFRALLPTEDDQ